MNLTLVRIQYRDDGVFGFLMDENEQEVAITLEHSYPGINTPFRAKIPLGKYVCKRGLHILHSMGSPFETFQVMDVPGHTNILFHWGNYNPDSEGCILLGESVVENGSRPQMITNSRATFHNFMVLQAGIDVFEFIVTD